MLLVKTQWFQCPDCHTTFNATSYLFEKQRTISRDLRREVILRLTRIQTIKDIAHDLFIVHTGYKMLENTDLKLSVFQHFFILVSY